jgi:acylphosphatase
LKLIFIRIGGKVHGVGFRYFAFHKANELSLVGQVKNTPDGKVEIEAFGEPEKLEIFVDWMKIGPARATISTFSLVGMNAFREYKGFTIN